MLAMLARRMCVGEPDGFGGHSDSPSPAELRMILGSKVRDIDRPEAERAVVLVGEVLDTTRLAVTAALDTSDTRLESNMGLDVEGDVGCLPKGTNGIDIRDSIFRAEEVVAGLRGIGMLDDRLGLVFICASVGARAHQETSETATTSTNHDQDSEVTCRTIKHTRRQLVFTVNYYGMSIEASNNALLPSVIRNVHSELYQKPLQNPYPFKTRQIP